MNCYSVVPSPLGELRIVVDDAGRLVRLDMLPFAPLPLDSVRDAALCSEVALQLQQYFAGERREFTLALAPRGTAFQQRAWQALLQIPFGESCSYAAQAARLGNGKAARAVGTANGRNPIAIVVPCHRVVGADGSLTGYAGGVERKRWLLAHERAVVGGLMPCR